jgi:DnaJ family protein B protein 11
MTADDAVFQRVNNDLHMTYHIDLVDALTGFTKSFAHFDGHLVGCCEL